MIPEYKSASLVSLSSRLFHPLSTQSASTLSRIPGLPPLALQQGQAQLVAERVEANQQEKAGRFSWPRNAASKPDQLTELASPARQLESQLMSSVSGLILLAQVLACAQM